MIHSVIRKHMAGSNPVPVKRGSASRRMGWILGLALILALLPCIASAGQAPNLDEQLIEAAGRGDLAGAKRLLENGAHVDAGDMIGRTPLMHAGLERHVEIVKLLLDRGANVNAQDKFGCSALLLARDPETLRILLNSGADLNVRAPDGATVLIGAAFRGNAEMVRMLLAKGLDVDARADNGFTALMYAAGYGHFEVIKLLLDKGASINAKENEGLTALMHAAKHGRLEAVKFLVEKGADVNAMGNDGSTALMAACGKPYDWEERQNSLMGFISDLLSGRFFRFGPLYRKIGTTDPEVVRFLLEKGADVNARTTNGWTALRWARKAGNPEIVRLLESRGAKD